MKYEYQITQKNPNDRFTWAVMCREVGSKWGFKTAVDGLTKAQAEDLLDGVSSSDDE